MLFGASAASAEPSIQEQRRQAELILAQVQELDAEIGAAAERFNGANYELGRLTERLRQNPNRPAASAVKRGPGLRSRLGSET